MKPTRKKINYDDSKLVNYSLLVVRELFTASDTRWVRAEDKRGDSKYFSEFEWLSLPNKKI